ncbi:hypothetical protein [Rhodovulum strictum]|uniref:Methyl-accepting chemotaxis protein n=1 Tax=Rhodovulum strictum TaxID=58314 RepID=A0A844B1Q8_9RHOB|nr:hypothetical protein [Rhodovulum strictum]MRH20296.1 hypothetical protein [Rhodovulum strictum]
MTAPLFHPLRPAPPRSDGAALDLLRAELERVFLAAGETLMSMEARCSELRAPLGELVEHAPVVIEAVDLYARQLAQSVHGLDDVLGRSNVDIDGLRQRVDALNGSVAIVVRTIKMMQFVATNARIQVFSLRPRHARLESFADNARALLDRCCVILAEVQKISDEVSAQLRVLARRRLPDLRAEVAGLRPGFEALGGAVAVFRDDRRNETAFGRPLAAHLDRLQQEFDDVIVRLQTGDRASQRIDHAGQILARADAEAAALVGLADAQLAGAFMDLRDETATITATLADSVHQFEEIAGTGSGASVNERLHAFALLVAEVERARDAVHAIRGRREVMLDTAGAVLERMADLRRVLGDVSSLAEDLRLVGTNAVLACAELGDEGEALKEIASQLRLLASDSAAQLRQVRDALAANDARTSDLIGDIQDGAARTIAEVEGAGEGLARDLDRVCQAGKVVTERTGALAASLRATVPGTCEAMQAQVARLAGLVGPTDADPAPPVAGPEFDAILDAIWAGYSMDAERDIHRAFCLAHGLDLPPDVSAGPAEELDIFF